jgi:hypothetical protein
MKRLFWILLGFGMICSVMSVNSYAGAEKYGQAITNRTVTPVKEILADPKAYEGKLVTVEGTIDNECSSGCWFFVKVKDANFTIYVDIGASGFAIPQYKGKKVIVEGVIVIKGSGPVIQGKGVEFP